MSFAYSSPRSYFAEEEPDGLVYDDYLVWLAEFLMQLPDEVPECQNKLWLSLADKSPEKAAWWLGEKAFCHNDYIEGLLWKLRDGDDYDTAFVEISAYWQEINGDGDPDCCDPLEDCINPAMWADAEREFKEMQAAGIKDPDDQRIDQGYRAILAKIVKQVDSQEERIKLLDICFKIYCENSSKQITACSSDQHP